MNEVFLEGKRKEEREMIGAFAVALLGKAPQQDFESPSSLTLQKLLEVETV